MLYYEIHNGIKDQWVIFLHGIGGSVKTWKKQINAFQDYNLLLIDLPGHGGSKDYTDITITSVNESIKEVLDYLKIDKADFVSLSLGSLVAIYFAIHNPKMVRSLVLGGSVININGTYKRWMKIAYKCRCLIPYRMMYKLLAIIMMPKKKHSLSRKIFIRESLRMSKKMFFAWFEYVMQILHSEEIIKKLKSLKLKIFFISGAEDRCFLSGTVQSVKEIGCCSLAIIKDCGHVCSIEKAQEFNKHTLNFIAQPA
jgi:pimeloyl-ACP methyl ester carboxylesterase